MKRAVVAIYIDPDYFPPTINAILNLADQMDEVIVISRNNSIRDYPYPQNVYLKKIGRKISVRDSENQPFWLKLYYFLKFTISLHQHAKKKITDLVLVYDPFALLAFFMVKHIRNKKKVWYHNHDMPDKTMLRKYSIGFFASKYERKAMRYIQYFSLPSKERLPYYPELIPEIQVFILPNYPSLKVYQRLNKKNLIKDKITIIYQGFIGKGHGLEEFIELLKDNFNGFELNLILKGSVTSDYKLFLNELTGKYNVVHKLIWKEIGPYYQIPELTTSCNIGIGINMNNDITSLTQSTSSNKIYEYAASGLPVILNDSEQFTQYLQKYKWAFFTDGSVNSIKEVIQLILKDLPGVSKAARESFEEELNFENNFIPAMESVLGLTRRPVEN